MRKKVFRTGLLALAGIGMVTGSGMMAEAKTPEELWHYDMASDEENHFVYDFAEVEMILPADWEGKYGIQTGTNPLTHDGYVTVYHTASRDALSEKYGEENAGGTLLTLTCSSDYQFMGVLPDYQIIGNGEECVYYVSLPTDVQGYPDDQAIWTEWQQLYGEVDWVLENIQMIDPGEDAAETEVFRPAGEYLIADSSDRYLTEQDLQGMNVYDLQMAINEIYARHHRKFATKSIQEYFDSKSWYSGTIEADKFDPASLSQCENANVALMLSCMKDAPRTTGSTGYTNIGNMSTGNTGSGNTTAGDSGTKMTATVTVNIRSKASTSGVIMGIVPQGYTVTVTGAASDGWIPVQYSGVRGYVKAEYLKEGAGTGNAGGSAASSASGSSSASASGDSQTAQSYDDLRRKGGVIRGTILDRNDSFIELEADNGEIYEFAFGEYSLAVAGNIDDYIELEYIGALNDHPQAISAKPKADSNEAASGTQTMAGTFVQEGQDIFTIRDESGNEYTFYKGGQYPASSFREGAAVTVTYYGEAGESAEVVSVN